MFQINQPFRYRDVSLPVVDDGYCESGGCVKIVVPVKRVIDANVRVRVKGDGSGVDYTNVKMAMNPFDEIAVEEALRQKEAGKAEEVIAVSIGSAKCEETLRTALAMGVDRAILVDTDARLEPLAVAKALKKVVENEQADLVILGKQAIDDDANQTGQMLATLLGYGQATFASKVQIVGSTLDVTQEVDGGLKTIRLGLPVVVTTDLRLNEPRYVSLPNIMKAKKKPLSRVTADELGVSLAPRLKILATEEPPHRKAGVRVGSVEELAGKLKDVMHAL
jgi:electron transfer flavoprotein beta subunit